MARSNIGDDSGKKGASGESQRKGAPKAKGASAAGARKSTKNTASIVTPLTKRRKKNSETNPLFVDPPDDAYAPYFKECGGKRAPNFTAQEDLVLCKSYAAISKDPTVGTNQTAKTFWGRFLRALSCSLHMREITDRSTSVLQSPWRIYSWEQSSPPWISSTGILKMWRIERSGV